MSDYPVSVDITSPAKFDRGQLLLRIGLAIVLAWVGISGGWLAGLLYIALPVMAAIVISTEGSAGYTQKFAPQLWRVLSWLVQLSAYLGLLVDRFPATAAAGQVVTPTIRFSGQPSVGSALSRLLTSIPSGLVLAVLSWISCVLWLVAFVFVLIGAPMPRSILAYQRGIVRWQARLLAYHASLVIEYPPFSLETDDTSSADLLAAGAR